VLNGEKWFQSHRIWLPQWLAHKIIVQFVSRQFTAPSRVLFQCRNMKSTSKGPTTFYLLLQLSECPWMATFNDLAWFMADLEGFLSHRLANIYIFCFFSSRHFICQILWCCKSHLVPHLKDCKAERCIAIRSLPYLISLHAANELRT